MATQKRKQTTKQKTAKSGKTRKNQVIEEEQENELLRSEAVILVSCAFAGLLFLSNFHLCGVIGDFLRSVQLGLFGMMGFLFPLGLFVATAFAISNPGNRTAKRKLIAAIAAFLIICAFAQAFVQIFFSGSPDEEEGILAFYEISSANGRGGGLVGGVIFRGLQTGIGDAGAVLVLAVLLVISIVCITEKSFVRAVKRGSGSVYRRAKEDIGKRQEIRRERREAMDEERKRREEQQRVRGVNLSSTDLSLGMEAAESEENVLEENVLESAMSAERGETAGSGSEGTVSLQNIAASRGRKTGNKKEEKAVRETENPASRADIFTGSIHMNTGEGTIEKEVDEDEVPFEEIPRVSVAESAQQLVDEGIYRSVQETGDTEDSPTNHEVFHEESSVSDITYEREVPPETEKKDRILSGGFQVRDDFDEEIIDFDAGEYEGDFRGITIEPSENSSVMGEEDPSGPKDQEIIRYMPESADGEFLSRAPGSVAGESLSPVLESSDGKFRSHAQESPVEEFISDIPASPGGEFIPADEGYDKPTSRGGSFYVQGGERRVETAGGKIIETETETLQKKLEQRRREVKEESGEAGVLDEIQKKEAEPKREYVFPPLSLLKKPTRAPGGRSEQEYRDTAVKLQQTLRTFGVGVTVTNISCGPAVTRYELHPEMGVKVSKIVGLSDDIKLSLAAEDIRIEAPIPGKSAVGIEVPNKETTVVYLRDLLESDSFKNHTSRLAFAVGKDISGQVVVTDIAKMPHLLIAGATGSGKSVCINTLIMSIIYKSKPEDVRMILVDPKVVELSVYNGIPHLLIPVVTDPKKAAGALNWAVAEMTDRYKKFAQYNVRDLKGFNARVEALKDIDDEKKPQKMPQIVIIIDELADLMMVASGEVEDAICRLAQLARACGIHLVIATQRPSVNVITGLIKANVPSRIAFAVSSGVDSRTILDMNGAEKLLGRGDMLFYPAGYPKPQRVQGALVSDAEVQAVVEFLTEQGGVATYDVEIEKKMNSSSVSAGGGKNNRDEYFADAGRFIIEKEKASIGMLQRMFKIGYNRAARIMDQLAQEGVVGGEEGTKPRKILMTKEEFEELLGRE
ncbi:MAG: DNA translocase FtsK [Clostridiales bacterium]|nr:DNA translocase FtsK [Clostridiales bacterium]